MQWGREADAAFLRTLPPEAPALRDMPELWPECELYLRAFWELSPVRPLGFGAAGFIPLSEVMVWAALYQVADAPTLWRHIRALDAVYIEHQTEKAKRDHGKR